MLFSYRIITFPIQKTFRHRVLMYFEFFHVLIHRKVPIHNVSYYLLSKYPTVNFLY